MTAPEPREGDYEPDVLIKAHCIHMLDCGCRPPLPEPREDVETVAKVRRRPGSPTGDAHGVPFPEPREDVAVAASWHHACTCNIAYGWSLLVEHAEDCPFGRALAERVRAAVEGARDENAVAEVGLTDAEWTRLRHAAGNRGDLGPIAEEVERILGERERAAAVEAWDEGYSDGLDYMSLPGSVRQVEPENPYRANRRAER